MKIILSAMGSDGDIRPMIALHQSLGKMSHELKFIVPESGEDLARSYGIEPLVAGIDYRDNIIDIKNDELGVDTLKVMKENISKQFASHEEFLMNDNPGLILGSGAQFACPHIAEKLEVPFYDVYFTNQLHRSDDHPAPAGLTSMGMPRIYNRVSWKLFQVTFNVTEAGLISPHRKRLGLDPLTDYFDKSHGKNTILAVDRELDPIDPNFLKNSMQIDYWHLFEEEKSVPELDAFLDTDRPVIYFGFGSMPDQKPEETIETLMHISRELGVRFIVTKGWSDYVTGHSDNIFLFDYISHHQLFPRLDGVVHHGGSGTTHTVSLQGPPQVIVPHFADQYYWADVIHRQGMCPEPEDINTLTGKSMLEKIRTMLEDKDMKDRCVQMSRKLKNRLTMDDIAETVLNFTL